MRDGIAHMTFAKCSDIRCDCSSCKAIFLREKLRYLENFVQDFVLGIRGHPLPSVLIY